MKPTAAVAYYRMSSDDQTVSVDRQRNEVLGYARDHGFCVLREYKDEGKSGSKEPEKRTDFQRLLMDASRGEFQAVLCYNASRFARLDSIDGAFAKQTLRQHGVFLQSVCEGRIDWNTVEGRMFDFMLSDQWSCRRAAP
jgi:DNA invertase Pin-like site-specific DNA recombinase